MGDARVPRAPLSAVVATYNGARYVEEQLASIASQVPAPAEILVGDDGSDDETVEVTERFAASTAVRVVVRRHQHLGYAENFLQTAAAATQPYIAFSDQDDVWLPGKVAAAVGALSRPDVMAWTHRATAVDEQLTPLPSRRFHTGLGERASRRNPLMPLPACMLAFDRRLLDWFPPRDRCRSVYRDMPAEHDEWIVFAAHACGRIGWDPTSRLLYRRHSAALGQFPTGSQESWSEVLMSVDRHRVSTVIDAASDRSGYLRRRAESPECRDIRDRLLRDADRYERLLPRLRRRADQRAAQGGRLRLRLLARAAASGDYGRVSRGALGWWAALQDGYAMRVEWSGRRSA